VILVEKVCPAKGSPTMKIIVIRDDGTPQTLTIIGEWNTREGNGRNRLIGPLGLTHFFRHSGEYDGWGSGVFEYQKDALPIPDLREAKRNN